MVWTCVRRSILGVKYMAHIILVSHEVTNQVSDRITLCVNEAHAVDFTIWRIELMNKFESLFKENTQIETQK